MDWALFCLSYHCGCVVNDFLCCQIAFVADQQLVNAFAGVTFDFLKPLLNVVKWLLVCAIVHNNNTVSATIIRRGDGTETLLASSVPLLSKVTLLGFELTQKRVQNISHLNYLNLILMQYSNRFVYYCCIREKYALLLVLWQAFFCACFQPLEED